MADPGPRLTDDIQYLPGVGPKRADHLRKLGITSVGDLLEYFPARHEREESRSIENLDEGMTATLVGRLAAVRTRFGRRGRAVTATLIDNTGRCSLCWFNAGWMADRLRTDMVVRVTGRVGEYRQLPQMVNPRLTVLSEDAAPVDESEPARFEAVYPATAAFSSRAIGKLITAHLDHLLEQVEEWHDAAHLKARNLPPRRWALRVMHRPQREDDVQRARRRLAYDELLLMQIATSLVRAVRRARAVAPALRCTPEIDRRIRRRFPFSLTAAQDRAIQGIVSDLARPRPMNRLLQGDVGCGKTVVALYAALVAVANKTQAAIMAPTELLAEQHARSIERYLAGSRVRHHLLVGGLPAAERRRIIEQIEQGELDLVVGTHALIQGDVRFARLGLVVVDEQHRFGVRQRAMIRGKGPAPHYLVMTATPIPRTLAMTVFGDLDVTTIDELPPGRSEIETRIVPPARQDAAWGFVRDRLDRGEQAYVVYPIIDESDRLEVRAATTECERLRGTVFARHRVGLLHGRMPRGDREAVMADFLARKLDVLVATTVIEVGIDVPDATCMVIEHAERYGLSQLHQLRGRIGRGSRRGYCLLMTGSDDAAASERLAALAATTDGFRIAEEDLRQRGPGEMLGTRQHGLPELRVADLLRDGELLRLAQRDAGDLVRDDPQLRRPRHAVLRRALLAKYEKTLGFLDVG
ncbi:MAG: ATP-dependent DNA helicase RecG [Phycisphaerae bacterium]